MSFSKVIVPISQNTHDSACSFRNPFRNPFRPFAKYRHYYRVRVRWSVVFLKRSYTPVVTQVCVWWAIVGPGTSVAQALVSSRFDYANSILYGAPKYNIFKLQRAQNVLARVVTRSHRRTSADALLHKLHWLPIEDRIFFKLALLTYKTLLIGSPSYLSTLLTIYRPPRTLRILTYYALLAQKLFRYAAPAIWNSLPTTSSRLVLSNRFVRTWKRFYFVNLVPN